MTIDMGPVISAVQSYGDARAAESESAAHDEDAAQIDALQQQVADLQAQLAEQTDPPPDPEPVPPPVATLIVGARAKDTDFPTMDSTIGPVKASRWFSGGSGATLPATFTRAYAGTAIAPTANVWASFNTASEANLRSYVASADPGTKMVLHHEPEGDFPSGADYVKWFDAQAAIIHDASDLPCVHAAAAYEYRSGGVGVDGSWVPDSADIYTIDTYRRTLADMVPLEQDDRFQRWLALVQPKGKPIGITEYGRGLIGQGAATDAKRAELIAIDGDYLRSLGAVVWMYWWTSGSAGNWRFTDQASIDAWRSQAAK
jgi:hypothetical protein